MDSLVKPGALRRFRDWNVALSWATTPKQLWESRGLGTFDRMARTLLARPGTHDVVDAGGGRTWHFGKQWWRNPKFRLIGIDIDPAELALNPDLDQRIAVDMCKDLGLPADSVDLVLCRAVIEHLYDTGAFLRNVMSILRPGGSAIFAFPNPVAPPFLLNKILPASWSARLLRWLVPGSSGIQGFPAHYDKCLYSTFERECKEIGFVVDVGHSGYYSSSYFQFFLPLHFVSILWDLIRQKTGIKNLGSANVFVISKPSPAQTEANNASPL